MAEGSGSFPIWGTATGVGSAVGGGKGGTGQAHFTCELLPALGVNRREKLHHLILHLSLALLSYNKS
jgi:hypothetical protein